MKVKEDTTGIPTRRRRGKPPTDSMKKAEDLTPRIIAYCDNRIKGFPPKLAGLMIDPTAGEQHVEVWEKNEGVRDYLTRHGMSQEQIEDAKVDTYMGLFWAVNESALKEMNRRINAKEDIVKVLPDNMLYQIIKDGLNVRAALTAQQGKDMDSPEGKDSLTAEAVRKLLPPQDDTG